jgi:hypothetical protein
MSFDLQMWNITVPMARRSRPADPKFLPPFGSRNL